MDRRTHHWPRQHCYYCGKKAVAWCDGINSYKAELVDGVPRILTKDPDVAEFCHRPLCDDHAVVIGMSTVSGTPDTVDYCPKHMTMQKHGKDPDFIYNNSK